jgi:histidinol-phosphate aminotransferase
MPLSRRAFVRSIGWGGVGVLSTEVIIGRGSEEAFAFGEQYGQFRESRPPGAIIISSNENPRGPATTALSALQGRTSYRVGRYPDNIGELAETVAKKFGGSRDNVLIATGSGAILAASVRAYASPTRPLVNGDPSYGSPNGTARDINAPVKLVPVDRSLKLDLGAMAAAAKGAGLVFVCNPNNPTATIHSKKDIADFVAAVRASSPETAILIDEAYIDYSDDPAAGSAAQLALEHPNVLIARTFSKAYGMAGLRLGYAFGQPATLKKLDAAWGVGSVNVLTAAAGTAALKDTAHMDAERAENKRVRDFTMNALNQMGFSGPASHSNFVFINIGRPAKEFREACAQRNVFVARDFPPMEKTHARITIGTMDEMRQAVDVFRSVLKAPTTTASGR